MSKTKDIKTNKPFDFKKDILYPGCLIFCIIVFAFYLVAFGLGENVTENTTHHTEIFDDITGSTVRDSEADAPMALPMPMLVGIFFFALAIMLAGQVFRLDYGRLMLRTFHFLGILFCFFVFILAIPGYVTGAGIPAALVATLAAAFLYFVFWGIRIGVLAAVGRVQKRFSASERYKKAVKVLCLIRDIIYASAGAFAVILFGISFFNLLSGVHVIVHENVERVFISDDQYKVSYIRVATPLAPTIQNYLRYFLSGMLYVIGYKLLFIPISKLKRGIFNFLILTAGYLGIWIFGMDYFRMVPQNVLPATVGYLAVYLAAAITVCVILAVKRRKNEDDEDYETQFAPGKRKK